MLNIEKYKDEMADNLDDGFNFEYVAKCAYYNASTENKSKEMSTILDWLCEEYKEPVLDDVEREYLKAVCKPFRNRTHLITKREVVPCPISMQKERIVIQLGREGYIETFIKLPPFDMESGMYKGMELNKRYTLEELGITYDE